MESLKIVMDAGADRFAALDGLEDGRVYIQNVREGIEVGVLPAGMASGAPSVAICVPLPNGRVVIAETSLALFLTAADAFRARYGDPRQADAFPYSPFDG